MADPERKLVLCPYCGHTQADSARCDDCGGWFEPLSREATQIAMGPWYIRDRSKPFHPGCSYEVLVKQVRAGRIKPTTVLRGPTTQQFWMVARQTPGVAHLLGYCHACNRHVDPSSSSCPRCNAKFEAVETRDALGLMFKTKEEADAAAATLPQRTKEAHANAAAAPAVAPQAEVDRSRLRPRPRSASGSATPSTPAAPGADLLGEVLGGPPDAIDAPGTAPTAREESPRAAGRRSGSPRLPQSRPEIPSQGQTLDFAPSAATADPTPTAPLPQRRAIGPLTWALISINGLILLGIVVFATVYFLQSNAAPPVPSASRPAPATQPSEATTRPAPTTPATPATSQPTPSAPAPTAD